MPDDNEVVTATDQVNSDSPRTAHFNGYNYILLVIGYMLAYVLAELRVQSVNAQLQECKANYTSLANAWQEVTDIILKGKK